MSQEMWRKENKIEIIPAIVPKTFDDLREKISLVKGKTFFVQIDIMDGIFVPEKSWPFSDPIWSEGIHMEIPFTCECNFEFHLMIAKPEYNIKDFVAIGARRIVIHVGATNKLKEIIQILKGRVEVGLALGLDDDFRDYAEFIEEVNFVQFMGIEKIGFQGQPFDERVIDKIIEFRSIFKNKIISVDGGVNLENAKKLISVGVRRIVSGSAIFESDDIVKTIEDFKKLEV